MIVANDENVYQAQLHHQGNFVELEKLIAAIDKDVQQQQEKNDQDVSDLEAKLLSKDEELHASQTYHESKCGHLRQMIDEKQEVLQQAQEAHNQEVLDLHRRR